MARTVLVREWLLILSIFLGAVGIFAAGWAYHLEMLEDDAEDLNIAVLMNDVRSNQEILTALMTKPTARPLSFDACAGTDLVNALRESGRVIPEMEFEQRCQQARHNEVQELKP